MEFRPDLSTNIVSYKLACSKQKDTRTCCLANICQQWTRSMLNFGLFHLPWLLSLSDSLGSTNHSSHCQRKKHYRYTSRTVNANIKPFNLISIALHGWITGASGVQNSQINALMLFKPRNVENTTKFNGSPWKLKIHKNNHSNKCQINELLIKNTAPSLVTVIYIAKSCYICNEAA